MNRKRERIIARDREIRKMYRELNEKKMYRFDYIVKQIADKFYLSEDYTAKIVTTSDPDKAA